ncbi:MAG: phosphate signaling complex protein PhoU [Lachnospiraceae bacterium]
MRNRFDRQLQQLNIELINMGNMIERAIELAVTAFVKQDADKAKEAIEYDSEINAMERDIETLCLKLLLEQQPVAKDLRMISSALKMITDMERIGDHASDISSITLEMINMDFIIQPEYIQKMAIETTDMLIRSINAYVNKDIELAQWVIDHDDVVDELFNQAKSRLIKLINENQDAGEQATDMLMVAKYFERIGDHATNIAEWVIFSITGAHVDDISTN